MFMPLAGNMSHPHAQNALTNSVIPLCSAVRKQLNLARSLLRVLPGSLAEGSLCPVRLFF